jgi:hypothetical protein
VEPVADLIADSGAVGRIAGELMGSVAIPVRALLLDKSEAANWALGWHQDRTVAVRDRLDVPGFGPWSVKDGQIHVQPPHEITASMVTLRVHVDAVNELNSPLAILPGTHSMGRLANGRIDELAAELAPVICLAGAGDVWAYRAAIVHSSAEQKGSGRRRVLQIAYAADDLPDGREWQPLV